MYHHWTFSTADFHLDIVLLRSKKSRYLPLRGKWSWWHDKCSNTFINLSTFRLFSSSSNGLETHGYSHYSHCIQWCNRRLKSTESRKSLMWLHSRVLWRMLLPSGKWDQGWAGSILGWYVFSLCWDFGHSGTTQVESYHLDSCLGSWRIIG